MGFKSILAIVAVSGAVLTAASAQAATVADGDFANPPGGASFITYDAPDSFGPWKVTQGSVDLIGNYWQSPTPGGGSVDLDGYYQAGGISQNLALAAGSYKLSFYLSGNPDSSLGSKTVQVSAGDAQQDFTFDTAVAGNSHGDMKYVLETLNFTTTGATTLNFTSLDNSTSAFGPVIGGVSLSAVPEPATWLMAICGFGLMGVALRRRPAAVLTA